jgi:hypothetical protein
MLKLSFLRVLITQRRLEQSCCKKRQKSPGQETDFENRGCLKALNDTKLVLNEHE